MKRNLVNFTRGSQLLGHFSFMFAAGLKGPLIVAAIVIAWTSWWTLSGSMSDHESYLVGMRIYAAIYGFMEFDPEKRIALETAFGGTVQLPVAMLESFPPVVRAWDHMLDLLGDALARSALLLVPAFALFYWFAARFGGRSKERKHERGALLVTLPELVDELITLNTDQKEVAFIIGDTPARLPASGIAIQNWATNAASATGNGEDGLVSASPFVGLYYPWGLSTNIDGADIMVPPSTIALRTIAYSDSVSYPWMAPAGAQRGLVTNATAVGFLTSEGEFRAVTLNQGQRDVLYTNRVNAIAYMPGSGALDRINVARLVNYMRFNLDKIVKPFLFQPNDAQTRDAARITVERFMVGLVGLRALEDFAVVCDLSNNTPTQRDRNELWIDCVVKPVKAVEFIYVPVRVRDSGASLDI